MTTRNNRARFLQNNMMAASGVTLTASGAKVGFPVTNLTDPYRYRMWIPPGTFVVTTANQKLYYNDGTDRTATIATGTYTYATLLTVVATALNAFSSGWTCTYDFSGGTFKFTIGRASGTKTLRCSVTTNAAWDMLGYTGSVDQTAATADEPRNHTSEWFTVDFGVARSPLAFVLFCAADALFPIASTATVTLKGNNVNDFSSPAISRTLTADNLGIVHWLDDLSDTSYRYWKFEFQDRKNTVGPEGFGLNIGYLGDYVTPASTNIAGGFTRTPNDLSVVVKSVAGVPFVRKLPKPWSWDGFTVDYMSGNDRQLLEGLGASLGVATPFILALDPTVMVSAAASEFTKYVRFSQPPRSTHIRYDLHSFGFAVEEVL